MILKAFRTALVSLAANKLRSVLAVLGIVIGVSAVIMMLAMGKGTEQTVQSSIMKLGTNLVFVGPGYRARGGGHARSAEVETLTVDDTNALRRLPYVRNVAPEVRATYQVKFRNENRGARVIGTWPSYLDCRAYAPAQGRFFDRSDVEGYRRVCVLGATVAKDLFRYVDPIGESVKIDRKNFQVVGVMEEKGGMRWMNFDEFVYVPITTAMDRLINRKHLDQIIVQVDKPEHIEAAIQVVDKEMRRRHRIAAEADPDFSISSMTDWLDRMRDMTGAFTILLAGIAAVSLLVGGIGIMNIMLVSVTERTREIGIRKAVGARKADILRQFLIESVTISVLGGVLGILIGIVGSSLLAKLPLWESLTRGRGGIESVIVPESVLLSFVFSCAVGIFFGIYPAMKAARMNPVEALRYE